MTTLKVEGMTCMHCAATVKQALESVAGVSEARILLEDGVAEVHGNADLAALMAAVEDEGYRASPQAG